jgi:hypothetical protein
LVDAKAVTYRAPVCAFPNDGLLRDVNTRSTFRFNACMTPMRAIIAHPLQLGLCIPICI